MIGPMVFEITTTIKSYCKSISIVSPQLHCQTGIIYVSGKKIKSVDIATQKVGFTLSTFESEKPKALFHLEMFKSNTRAQVKPKKYSEGVI